MWKTSIPCLLRAALGRLSTVGGRWLQGSLSCSLQRPSSLNSREHHHAARSAAPHTACGSITKLSVYAPEGAAAFVGLNPSRLASAACTMPVARCALDFQACKAPSILYYSQPAPSSFRSSLHLILTNLHVQRLIEAGLCPSLFCRPSAVLTGSTPVLLCRSSTGVACPMRIN